jgi:Xaa-Pro aminopeptidase
VLYPLNCKGVERKQNLNHTQTPSNQQIGAPNMNKVLKLKNALTQKASSFLILSQINIVYYTGFSGAIALLIPKDGESTLYVAPVNYEQAKAEVKDCKVELLKRGENLFEKVAKQTNPQVNAKLAVDNINIENYRALAKAVDGENKLQPASNIIRDLRAIKTPEEIELIRQACKLADIGVQTVCEVLKPGLTELEIAAEVEYAMRKHGSCGTAFDTIVASGKNAAYPHGTCENRTIQNGDLVILDLGATVSNYRSDITRTFTAGKPTARQQQIYDAVKTAQNLAFNLVKPNINAKDIDATAREAINLAGFGDYFCHNVGHGVGLEVHEAPTLSPDSKDILAKDMVVTVEPGIYITGFGGVRIEDTVHITAKGAEKLTASPYNLQV